MQYFVNQALTQLGCRNLSVLVVSTPYPVARAAGVNLGQLHSLLPITGTISIDRSYLHNYGFIDNEVKFILAHEVAHIFKNHLVGTVFWYLIEQLAKGARNENYYSVEFAKIIFMLTSPDSLPPNALLLRDQEYEADEIAVRYITGNLNGAIACLTKLSGGNLNGPSHTWELVGFNVPAMTLQERIDQLHRRIARI
jgi:Zn-dependent protease with chaperone function